MGIPPVSGSGYAYHTPHHRNLTPAEKAELQLLFNQIADILKNIGKPNFNYKAYNVLIQQLQNVIQQIEGLMPPLEPNLVAQLNQVSQGLSGISPNQNPQQVMLEYTYTVQALQQLEQIIKS